MEKILSIETPPIETYQGTSFILAILLSNNKTKNVYYNNYINLTVDSIDNYGNIGLRFTNIFWEDYRLDGLANMELYYIKNIEQSYFVNFLKKLIDQNNYLLLFDIDEYYLSYSDYYHKEHFVHDTYIYGYDSDNFYIMAYSQDSLQRIQISVNEIKDSIYHRFYEDNNVFFCTFQLSDNRFVSLDLELISRELNDYLQKKGHDLYAKDNVYGIETYSILYKYINFIEETCYIFNNKIDLKLFKVFWEHKKVMKDRISYINEVHSISSRELEKIDHIEKQAKIIFLFAIKYNLSKQKSILNKILLLMKKIQDEEIELITKLLDEIQDIIP